MATFTIILGTTGRKTVTRTLASIAPQLQPGDELFILRDDSGDAGDTPRNQTMHRAAGTHLLFMDDDDQFAIGALATMRRFASENPGRIGIFRMRFLDGRVLWTEPILRLRNISSQMLCIPNLPGKLGRWESPEYDRIADYEFVRATVELQGEPIFRDEVVAHIRSDRRPAGRALKRVATPLQDLRFRIAPATRARRMLGRLRG